MALANLTTWQVQNGGSDTANAGGFRGPNPADQVAAPSAPSVAGSGSGGTVAAGTYYVVVTYTDILGETVISGQTSVTTTGTTSSITVTSPPTLTGALTWSCYVATTTGGPYWPQGTGLTIGSNRVITTTPPTSGTQPRGTDFSVSNTPTISVSDAVANSTTTVTSATAGFTGAHVGSVVKIGSAFYDIQAVTNATTIVVDRTITTASGQTLIVGGGFATPGQVASLTTASGWTTFIRGNGDTYTFSNSANVAGGRVSDTNTAQWIGYATNRTRANTDSTRPVCSPSANSVVMFAWGTNLLANISCANAGAFTSCVAFRSNAHGGQIRNCKASAYSTGFDLTTGSNIDYTVFACEATGCGTSFTANNFPNYFVGCVSSSATTAAFAGGVDITCIDCIAQNTSGGDAFAAGLAINCIAYATVNHNGFTLNKGFTAINCISYGNTSSGGNGFAGGHASGFGTNPLLINCASGGNGGSNFTGFYSYELLGCVTLSADPFTNKAGGDFSLNTTAGGGAACRAAGVPGVYPGIGTTGYRDIGVQHAAASGGGGPVIGCSFIRGK